MGEGRETAFGENADAVGMHMALGILITIGLTINRAFKRPTSRVLVLLLCLPLAVGLVKSGTSGAMIALVFGIVTYLMPFARFRRKLVSIVLGILRY